MCMQAAKALTSLCTANLSELSLLADAIITKVSCAGPHVFCAHKNCSIMIETFLLSAHNINYET